VADDRKQIVLTGVSRGLGRAMLEGFAKRGHTVFGCARSERAVKQLQQQFAAPHRFDAVDVADDPRVAAWAKSVLEQSGPPDLLINNAATINANAALWNVPPDEFSSVIDVNIKGMFYVIRHFVPAMIKRGSGVIVNFSSGWGRSTSPEVAPYCASKWAVEGLTRAMADELPSGLAAVPLNPGVIHTEMLESCFGEDASSFPTPDEWANKAVPFLLELGPYDNGEPLSVSG
jgi:NAD(P)-dependent dehydrogenase (short-subunit alcohol dehydrogenase family)